VTPHRVLLVGGQGEFVGRKVTPRLETMTAPDGATVRIVRHVAWKTDRFPTDYVRVDAIMVVTDMVSHTLSNAARDHARRLVVPYVPISRKWLESAASLVRYGYCAFPVPEASAPPAAAPVEAATPTPAPEVPMPPTRRSDANMRRVIQTLASNPGATNADLTEIHGDGCRPLLAEARKKLGIVSPRGNSLHRTVSLVPTTFVSACAAYGVSDEIACASLARYSKIEEAAPAPAPVPAPPSPMDTLFRQMDTLREAVALLRAAMADADVISISIDREGKVVAERMAITTIRL
jgi:hypothetical protein